MEFVIVVPGIMGSVLETPDKVEVWPPTPKEAVLGYKRVDQLIRKDLKATKIIDRVCIDVYGSLLKAIDGFGYKTDTGNRRIVHFAYDWRMDLLKTSKELDAVLAKIRADHGNGVKIRLLCHSMGGLIARVCLERHGAVPEWTSSVDLCVFMATPHEGAPLAVSRAAGVADGTLGLSPAQLRQLAGQPGYPAAYQLFPLSTLLPVWQLDSESPFDGIGVFDPELAQLYGFNPANLAASRALQQALDCDRRPAGCRYFSVVSAFHETVTRFDLDRGQLTEVAVAASGDGTVPIRSASALPVQTAFVTGNHLGVTQDGTTHDLLAMLLGVKPVGVIAAGAPNQAEMPRLSASAPVIAEGDDFEVVLAFGSAPRRGRLVFARHADGVVTEEHAIPLDVGSSDVRQVVLSGPELPLGVYDIIYHPDEGAPTTTEILVMKPGS